MMTPRLPSWLPWPRASVRVHAEQALYGSFPFRHKGYELLAHSPGCTPEQRDAFRHACAGFGERPGGVSADGALFALRIPGRPSTWMIVAVGEVGTDDRGRPGALAFHALFLTHHDYRRIGASPFALAAHHRTRWASDPGPLPSLTLRLDRDTPHQQSPGSFPANPEAVAHALRHGRRVVLETTGPIDGLARAVWAELPQRVRLRRRVATWAFGNDNRFDLVAVPRLVLVDLDASYADPATLQSPPPPRPRWRDRLPHRPRRPVQYGHHD